MGVWLRIGGEKRGSDCCVGSGTGIAKKGSHVSSVFSFSASLTAFSHGVLLHPGLVPLSGWVSLTTAGRVRGPQATEELLGSGCARVEIPASSYAPGAVWPWAWGAAVGDASDRMGGEPRLRVCRLGSRSGPIWGGCGRGPCLQGGRMTTFATFGERSSCHSPASFLLKPPSEENMSTASWKLFRLLLLFPRLPPCGALEVGVGGKPLFPVPSPLAADIVKFRVSKSKEQMFFPTWCCV